MRFGEVQHSRKRSSADHTAHSRTYTSRQQQTSARPCVRYATKHERQGWPVVLLNVLLSSAVGNCSRKAYQENFFCWHPAWELGWKMGRQQSGKMFSRHPSGLVRWKRKRQPIELLCWHPALVATHRKLWWLRVGRDDQEN